ncbi:MAG: hypothetical protein SGARI_002596 [Bacillariaceae sp.]
MTKKKERKGRGDRKNSKQNGAAKGGDSSPGEGIKKTIETNLQLQKLINAMEPLYPLMMHMEVRKITPHENILLAKIHIQDYDNQTKQGLFVYTTDFQLHSRDIRNLRISISGVPIRDTPAWKWDGNNLKLKFLGGRVLLRGTVQGSKKGEKIPTENKLNATLVFRDAAICDGFASMALNCDKQNVFSTIDEEHLSDLSEFSKVVSEAAMTPMEKRGRILTMELIHKHTVLHDIANLAFLFTIECPGGTALAFQLPEGHYSAEDERLVWHVNSAPPISAAVLPRLSFFLAGIPFPIQTSCRAFDGDTIVVQYDEKIALMFRIPVSQGQRLDFSGGLCLVSVVIFVDGEESIKKRLAILRDIAANDVIEKDC